MLASAKPVNSIGLKNYQNNEPRSYAFDHSQAMAYEQATAPLESLSQANYKSKNT